VRGPIGSSFAGPYSAACAEIFDGVSSHSEIVDVKELGPRQAREVEGMPPNFTSPAEISTDSAVTPNESMTTHPELKSLQ